MHPNCGVVIIMPDGARFTKDLKGAADYSEQNYDVTPNFCALFRMTPSGRHRNDNFRAWNLGEDGVAACGAGRISIYDAKYTRFKTLHAFCNEKDDVDVSTVRVPSFVQEMGEVTSLGLNDADHPNQGYSVIVDMNSKTKVLSPTGVQSSILEALINEDVVGSPAGVFEKLSLVRDGAGGDQVAQCVHAAEGFGLG